MIHIVEINEQHRACAWFAFDEADFIRKVQVDHGTQPDMLIYAQTTARQLAAEALAAQYGWDTPLYRADYLLGQGAYQTEPVSELRASLAAVASASDFRIYPDDGTAADELDRDPLFQTREGFEAGRKLRAQLVEMEVLAEDF
jgi:hypothetical protein